LRWHNKIIFEDFREHSFKVVDHIIGWYHTTKIHKKDTSNKQKKVWETSETFMASYFHGAAQRNLCGCGFWLRMS